MSQTVHPVWCEAVSEMTIDGKRCLVVIGGDQAITIDLNGGSPGFPSVRAMLLSQLGGHARAQSPAPGAPVDINLNVNVAGNGTLGRGTGKSVVVRDKWGSITGIDSVDEFDTTPKP
jgi:hypothetical protein